MKYIILVASLLCSSFLRGQQIQACNIGQLMARTSAADTVYVVNFWATWCAPCVQELPEFNKLQRMYDGRPVKILLVSLDFKENFPQKLSWFLERKKVLPEVVWLSETNPNVFVPKVDPSWQGSIPATIVLYKGKQFREFKEGSITAKQLGRMVDGLLND